MPENPSAEYARHVTLEVAIDGKDVSGPLAPYLLDFTFKDEAGGKSDSLEISLQNKDGRFADNWLPSKGMPVTATIICHDWQAAGADLSLPCGLFTIDETEISGPPDKIRIKAVSASLTNGLRDTKNTKAWENASLQTVARQIASQNSLELMFYGPNINFERRDQRNESDLAFLNRLAGEFSFSCKAHNGKLILFDSEQAEAANSEIEIAKTGSMYSPKSWSFKLASSDTGYSNAEIAYTDPKTGKTLKATAKAEKNEQSKTLTIQQRAENASQAMKLARSELHKKNQKEETASLEIMGNPALVAGINLNLTGFGKFSGKWFIKSASHKISGSSGYATSLELNRAAPTKDGKAQEFVRQA